MRILFTSLRNTGHFLPLVPFIKACRAAGHAVAVAGPEELRQRAEACSDRYYPFAHPGDERLGPYWQRVRDAEGDEGSRIIVGEVFAGIDAEFALPDTRAALADFGAELVVHEAAEFSGPLSAAAAGVPHLRVDISPGGAQDMILDHSAPYVSAHRQALGLPPDADNAWLRNETVWTLFPACLDPRPDSLPGVVHRFREPLPTPQPLADYWDGSAAPLIYASLGTVASSMDAARGMYDKLLSAVAELDARVLLTTGKDFDPASLGSLPPHVHAASFIPQADILPHAAAVIGHGGSGTTLGTLAHGVPTVVTALFADQPRNAERVAAVGAGIALDGHTATPAAITEAVQRVLDEPGFRAAAERVAAEMAALPCVDDTPASLAALLR